MTPKCEHWVLKPMSLLTNWKKKKKKKCTKRYEITSIAVLAQNLHFALKSAADLNSRSHFFLTNVNGKHLEIENSFPAVLNTDWFSKFLCKNSYAWCFFPGIFLSDQWNLGEYKHEAKHELFLASPALLYITKQKHH